MNNVVHEILLGFLLTYFSLLLEIIFWYNFVNFSVQDGKTTLPHCLRTKQQSYGFVIDAIGPQLVGYEGPNLPIMLFERYKI